MPLLWVRVNSRVRCTHLYTAHSEHRCSTASAESLCFAQAAQICDAASHVFLGRLSWLSWQHLAPVLLFILGILDDLR